MSENNTSVKIERKRAINRLESMHPLRALVQQNYEDTVQAFKDGKPTVWAMNVKWEDVPLMAMDLNIVYPENYASLVASLGQAEPFLDAADAQGYPTHLCGYARCTLGYTYQMMEEFGGHVPPDAPGGGMAKPALLLSSGSQCDTRFKWFQALGRYFDAPQWFFDQSQIDNYEGTQQDIEDYHVKFTINRLREFIVFLEKLLGRKMDWARLEELVNLTLDIHETMWQITELRKAVPGPQHSIDFWSTMGPSLFSPGSYKNAKLALKYYQDMLEEVRERVENKVSAINYPEKYRLIFADLPPWHGMKFFGSLAERGWNFVYESYGYHNPRPLDLTGVTDPLEKLALLSRNFYFHGLQHAKENSIANYYVDAYLEAARDYKADGFFLHPLVTCRPMSAPLRTMQNMLEEKMGVPSLWAEGDIIDARVFNVQEVLSRTDAFEQTMEHYRAVRKKKGLDW